jgi:TMEM199 family protein
MVLLCMTPAVAEVVELFLEHVPKENLQEPSLESPAEGKPISHGQLIDISHYLKANGIKSTKNGKSLPTRLEELLKGCSIYKPPKPQSKPKVCHFHQR